MVGFGSKNTNVWDYEVNVCYYSYLLSTEIMSTSVNVNLTKSQYLLDHHQTFINSSEAILSDTIDSLARIWLDI